MDETGLGKLKNFSSKLLLQQGMHYRCWLKFIIVLLIHLKGAYNIYTDYMNAMKLRIMLY
jgi:hypothetical protein